jgi:hypothetical protein
MTLQRFVNLTSLTVVTALLCLLLAGLRIAAETSFPHPKHRPTSGLEEEALFSIWKVTQHEPVYADPFQIPYAISYFNWLFYALYGFAGMFALNILQLDGGWLPTVTRSLSLGLTIGCVYAFYEVARQGQLWPARWNQRQRVSLATIAVFNPLFGFFNFTTRPDAGALFFELVGLALVLRYLRLGNKRRIILVLAAIAFYAAWSFKQSAVLALGGVSLWFLMRRRFFDLFVLAGVSVALYLPAFWIGGPNYFYALIKSQTHCAFQFSIVLGNFARACGKSPCLPLALIFATVAALDRNKPRGAGLGGPIPIVFFFSFIGAAVMSMKVGASDYYCLGPCLVGLLWLIGWCATPSPSRWPERSILAGVCLQLVAVAIVLTGKAGVIRDPAEQDRHERLAQELAHRPGPVLISERFANLPWIQQKPPHFVYAYTYYFDRAAGQTYAHGGLAGLIRQHYFKTIVLRSSEPPPERASFDGQPLDGYARVQSLAGYDFYELGANLPNLKLATP